jgi:dihydrofolate synthase/folylpolyglutamate synthase
MGPDFDITDNRVAFGGRYLSMGTTAGPYDGLFLPLHGAHQGANAAVALQAAASFLPAQRIDASVVADGFATAIVPGRLETMRGTDDGSPTVVLDVAHNPDGMSALIASLLEAFAFHSITFVLGILSDKDYEGMLAEMARVPGRIVATQPRTVRSVAAEDIQSAAAANGIEAMTVDSVADAVKIAISDTPQSDLVVVTGSHYVVGEARDLLLGPADL